jgi:hypothetical protein
MKFQIKIMDQSEAHLAGKKKPWSDRIDYPNWVPIYALITRATFIFALVAILIVAKNSWWIWILLSIANLWIYGETLATKEKYYRIGVFDGSRQKEQILGDYYNT